LRTHLWERLLLALIGLKLLGALLGAGWGAPSSTDRAEAAILSQLPLLLPPRA
jgi:hypothetical protein